MVTKMIEISAMKASEVLNLTPQNTTDVLKEHNDEDCLGAPTSSGYLERYKLLMKKRNLKLDLKREIHKDGSPENVFECEDLQNKSTSPKSPRNGN